MFDKRRSVRPGNRPIRGAARRHQITIGSAFGQATQSVRRGLFLLNPRPQKARNRRYRYICTGWQVGNRGRGMGVGASGGAFAVAGVLISRLILGWLIRLAVGFLINPVALNGGYDNHRRRRNLRPIRRQRFFDGQHFHGFSAQPFSQGCAVRVPAVALQCLVANRRRGRHPQTQGQVFMPKPTVPQRLRRTTAHRLSRSLSPT